jgi:hypothetical protein
VATNTHAHKVWVGLAQMRNAPTQSLVRNTT